MLNLIKFPRVFTINQVPKVFHEDGIISGYRHPRSSATDCILSLFQRTNETLNIWTHFLPSWYFLWKLLTVVLMQAVWQDSFTWPLVVFLLSCCVYPLASSCAHTFSTMSLRARHICFFFDYGALSFYSLGSAIVYSAYIFPDKWVNGLFHHWYIPIAVVNAFISTIMACYSRLGFPFLHYNQDVVKRFHECPKPKFSKFLRGVAFIYPYMFDNIPLFYRVFLCVGEGCTDNETTVLHYQHISLAFLTGFLFVSHLPERLAPGSFDFIGHSHQLFHVCAIVCTHLQMQAVEQDMVTRRPWLSVNSTPVTFAGSLGSTLLCVAMNLLIILIFSLPLLSASVCQDGKHGNEPKASNKSCHCS
ncbi:membrane progestin receptor gamma-B [Austrofundulus limnaeus]|uniref:Membrane progestin receptor gamma n=1 Tax=Austrofundulus limnaeus TaxID=52670 RepID=A0A2I4ANG9_AUSLI|nr:PREDICTED: membrane progestin receptor gamma [Austrofundulus limnaeus]XP_013857006.1 PREDICTED: membrane progestin receptor gamma [Austrofundulus limnaeus]